MGSHMLVQYSVWSVAKGDVDELQDRRRQLSHVCEVELHRVFPGHRFCQAAPHLYRHDSTSTALIFCLLWCRMLQ